MSVSLVGAEYITALGTRASDRAARTAFQNLALSLARPGDSVFDFGCGPGIDARVYAENGLEVGAYDVDPAMCAYFRTHCAAPLASGAIRLHVSGYPDFLVAHDLPGTAGVALITANFAPLNLVDDLPALFERFASMLMPGGHVLASVLNPLCAADLRYGWWWRNAPRLALRGAYALPGAQAPITRRMPGHIAALAAPRFALVGVYADHARPSAPGALPPRLHFASRHAWRLFASRFLFLQLRLTERAA